MKKRILCLLCAAAMLALAACAPVGEVNTPSPPPESATPVPTPTPTPEPMPEPTPTVATSEHFPFAVLPVTEEAIQSHFAAIGQPANSITPYEGDYLVEASASPNGSSYRLYWVFGSTGRTVWLTGALWGIESYAIEGRGRLLLHITGSGDDGILGFPEIYNLRVLGDENGSILGADGTETDMYSDTTYIALEDLVEPATFYFGGAVTGEGCSYVQFSDARIGVNDLSFSFVPSGASMERFNSCMAGPQVTIPSTRMQFDPGSRLLTIRFYNTCLSAKNGFTQKDLEKVIGKWEASYYHYPYSFPEGSLGRDSGYLRDVELHPDGEDVILTCTVDETVKSFTVDFYNYGTQQRIIFSEEEPNYPLTRGEE